MAKKKHNEYKNIVVGKKTKTSPDEARKKIIIELMESDFYVPMKEKEVAIMLQVAPEDRPELSRILNELLMDNKITISKRGKYSKAEGKVFTGTYRSSNKGYGFVTVDGVKDDFFIGKDYTGGAFHDDIVMITPLRKKNGEHEEAKVIGIVERTIKQIVGVFDKSPSKEYGFVIADSKFIDDVFIPGGSTMKAKNGQKVVVDMTSYGGDGRKAEGKIVEILGREGDKGVDVLSVIRGFGIPEEFSDDIMQYVKSVPKNIKNEDISDRLDLRNEIMVTIDGEDSKDLDDAVSLKKLDDGLVELGVHIADVSHYVTERSLLDKEALNRGTSVYFADRVIPMLPKELSNGICSLNAHTDRLAMSCIMKIGKDGEVVDYKIAKTVINVNHRMTYKDVNLIINGDEAKQLLYFDIKDMLLDMKELSFVLTDKRKKRGAIDFDTPEAKFILDKNGKCIEVVPYEANDATRLIENFMLLANEIVASHMYYLDLPFLYRVHETPDSDKIESLALTVRNFGYHLKGDKEEMHPKELQKLLKEFEGKPEEKMISRMTLRSMKQARYSSECLGHFGLALKEYTHFTSPIRRYPDLQIHRILKQEITEHLSSKDIKHYNGILDEVAKKSSKMERRAVEAEREIDKLKKAEYMENHIGEEYDGYISGVTAFGIYVELANTCEGLVHISKLPGDYFDYDEKRMTIRGNRKGDEYTLGQKVRIRVKEVDLNLKTVDFDILQKYDD